MNGQTEKTVQLPSDPEDIIRRLSSVNDENNIVEKLYPEIASYAGLELLPMGFAMMIMLAAYNFGLQYPPPMGSIVLQFIPLWIDALVDDKEGAETAKQYLKQAEDKAEAQRKANTPPRVEPGGPVENYDLYVAVRKVADLVFEYASGDVNISRDHIWLEDRREGKVNPFYNQTESGLFLEFYYGQPSSVWTPWGKYGFGGSGSGDWGLVIPRILERFGTTLYQPERNTNQGTFGPVYAIHRVDDLRLPEPQWREPQNYLAYEVVEQAWNNMTRRYNSERKV